MKIIKKIKSIAKTLLMRSAIKQALVEGDSIKIILGAGGTKFKGWISTDLPALDITSDESWSRLFAPNQIEAMLAEHVIEHLSDDQVRSALLNCYRYLQPGGYFRLAVPDGFHPNAEYIDMVKPGGTGLGSDDHKQLFDYKSLSLQLESIGFEVKPLEWFNERGEFSFNQWAPEAGMVCRSSRYDDRNHQAPLAYTSLIIDAIKPG